MSQTQTQAALVIPEHLSPLKIIQIPIYTPDRGELLVKIHAAALNPADWKIQTEEYLECMDKFPVVIGLDRAGEVVQVGEGVQGFKKGDRIVTPSAFVRSRYQGFQQYAIADAAFTAKIPSNITYSQAATLPIALSTAFSGLFAEFPYGAGFPAPYSDEDRKTGAGKAILIIGGASSVGQFTIQCAKLAGFSTIITTASLTNASALKSQGATHVIDRSLDAESVISRISSIKPSDPVEVVFDAIGLKSTEKFGFEVLAHFKQNIFVTSDAAPSELAAARTSVKTSKIIAAPQMPWNSNLLSSLFHDKLYEWLEAGVIKPNRLEVLDGGLNAVYEGIKRLENNQVSGVKLVVNPQETA
ncbi:GroES-like protein [Crepidotus variabilis]|uniref:GroES-like protein n=1 Tax=Crepidotus variabilis TaxID=179855 RepID=A0A9P6EDH1_9AGAR|nr:GroES-like protein [Crepidotus variabilis]